MFQSISLVLKWPRVNFRALWGQIWPKNDNRGKIVLGPPRDPQGVSQSVMNDQYFHTTFDILVIQYNLSYYWGCSLWWGVAPLVLGSLVHFIPKFCFGALFSPKRGARNAPRTISRPKLSTDMNTHRFITLVFQNPMDRFHPKIL